MVASHSITQKWLPEFKAGNELAIDEIWRRFFGRIVRVVRRRLVDRGVPRRVEDEEDVALSVFRRLCDMADKGDLDEISRGDDLWVLLMTITAGKVTDLIRRQVATKRGGGKVKGESHFGREGTSADCDSGMRTFAADELSPASQLVVADELERLLTLLPDAATRAVAERYLQGYKKTDVARELGIGRQAVYRKLALIFSIWRGEANNDAV